MFNQYLFQHGISQTSKERFGLENLSDKIGIPIKDKSGNILFHKYRNLKHKPDSKIPKFYFDKGGYAVLFNPSALENLNIVISEGEFDCIKLNQEGIASVSGTAGVSTFLNDGYMNLKAKHASFVLILINQARKTLLKWRISYLKLE